MPAISRERVFRTLTFWLRPAFALRVVGRFQQIAGFDLQYLEIPPDDTASLPQQ